MTHYDEVLGAPDDHERKIALDKLVAELTEPLGFEEWWGKNWEKMILSSTLLSAEHAYQAGRNYQREADAQIAENQGEPEIAKAIRNQGEAK